MGLYSKIKQTLIRGLDGTIADVCSCGTKNGLYVHSTGAIDADNSTSTPLIAGGSFNGSAVEIIDESVICVSVYSDQDSASGGLVISQSTDGTNWDHTDVYTITGGEGENYTINPHAKYYKIDYTNNAVTGQTEFRLQSILKATYVKPSSHRVGGDISNQDDAELVKAVLSGENGNGQFHNVKTTADGNLTVSDESSGLAIAEGNVSGKTFIHKFGAAPDFDVADGFVTVWDGADDAGIAQMEYQYSTTADIGLLCSSSASDTGDIEIQVLDSNYELVTYTVTLNGQTDVDVSAVGGTDGIRVFRMKNVGSSDFVGDVYIRQNGTTQTAGVPDTATSVRAVVRNGNNQTEMAVYTIPAGKTGYMRDWYASTAGAKRDSAHTIKVLARPFGQVFQLKHTSNIDVNGTSYLQHKYIEPEVFAEKTDIEMKMDTDQDIAGVATGFDIVLVDN